MPTFFKAFLIGLVSVISLQAHQCQFNNGHYDPFDYVNFWRQKSGLHPLKHNATLEKAALNHSRYRTRYKTGHHERKGTIGFTGSTPSDRAVYAGYPIRMATENIAEAPTAMRGVENLMTAIYHRFAFLNYNIDEMGVAKAKTRGKNSIYTYVMGNSFLAKECQQSSYKKKESPFYRNVCKDKAQKIAVKTKERLDASLIRYAPTFVLYPYENATKVLPAFYEEFPDPLPRYTMVGNPLSIEFHPRYSKKSIEVKDVRLRDLTASKQIALLPLYQRNDPHKKLLRTQFAFFPKQRLEWGHRYEARLKYKTGRSSYSRDLLWRFETAHMPSMLTVDAKHKKFKLKSHQTYTLYFKPDARASKSKKSVHPRFSYKYYQGTKMHQHIIDSMTLQICLHGKPGDLFKVKSESALGVDEVTLILE